MVKAILIVGALAVAFFLGVLSERKVESIGENSRWKAIVGNLRQFASAGQQYLMQYGGDEVSYQTLVEREYFSGFYSVMGEDYSDLVFRRDESVAYVQIPNTAYYVLYHY